MTSCLWLVLLLWPAVPSRAAPKRVGENDRTFIRHHMGLGTLARGRCWHLRKRADWERSRDDPAWKRTSDEARQVCERYHKRYEEAIRLTRKGYGLDGPGRSWTTRFSEDGRSGDWPAFTDRSGTVVYWHALADEAPDFLGLVLAHESAVFNALRRGRSRDSSLEREALRDTLALARSWNDKGSLDTIVASLERESGVRASLRRCPKPGEKRGGSLSASEEAAVLRRWLDEYVRLGAVRRGIERRRREP